MLGLRSGSYEAYCLDEAVIFFGSMLENELQDAGHKASKEERRAQMARDRIMDRVLGDDKDPKKGSGYADPAAMFG